MEFGHPGITNTVKAIQRNCYFEDMKTHVKNFIRQCESCQKNKHSTHVNKVPQTIEKPKKPWQSVTMDFITKLPLSKDPITEIEYDSIWVVVDRYLKWTYCLPFKENYTAKDLGFLWRDRIVRIRGNPEEIISDRDKLFTSAYWKTLMECFGTKLKFSTAYHPQTDGQTERMNQILETFLRHYVNTNINNWVELLPEAEIALSKRESATTKQTPQERNATNITTPSQEAITKSQEIKAVQRLEGLEEGDKAYLSTKNLRTTRPSKKLDHKRIGPFKIIGKPGPATRKLQLPRDAKIHPVFNVLLLSSAHQDTPVQTTFHYEADGEFEFEVETILAKNNKNQYLVHWKGYPSSEDTWEPASNLRNCRQKVKEWSRKNQNHQDASKEELTR